MRHEFVARSPHLLPLPLTEDKDARTPHREWQLDRMSVKRERLKSHVRPGEELTDRAGISARAIREEGQPPLQMPSVYQ
jgi:hypothetical protein